MFDPSTQMLIGAATSHRRVKQGASCDAEKSAHAFGYSGINRNGVLDIEPG